MITETEPMIETKIVIIKGEIGVKETCNVMKAGQQEIKTRYIEFISFI